MIQKRDQSLAAQGGKKFYPEELFTKNQIAIDCGQKDWHQILYLWSSDFKFFYDVGPFGNGICHRIVRSSFIVKHSELGSQTKGFWERGVDLQIISIEISYFRFEAIDFLRKIIVISV